MLWLARLTVIASLLAHAACASGDEDGPRHTSDSGPGQTDGGQSVEGTPSTDAGRGSTDDAATPDPDAGRTSDGGSEPRERPTIECEEPDDCELVRCECEDGLTVEQQACFDGKCVDEDDCAYYCG